MLPSSLCEEEYHNTWELSKPHCHSFDQKFISTKDQRNKIVQLDIQHSEITQIKGPDYHGY